MSEHENAVVPELVAKIKSGRARMTKFSKGEAAAILTVLLIKRYIESSKRDMTRLRMSRKSLRLMTRCAILRTAIIEDWIEVMERYGWAVALHHDNFFIFKIVVADKGWLRVSTKPIINEIGKFGSDGCDAMLESVAAELSVPAMDMEDDED